MVIERWQDYQARPGAINAARNIRGPVPLGTDAPFALRSIAAYRPANADGSGASTALQGMLRISNALGDWQQVNLCGTVEDIQQGGLNGLYSAIWPQLLYPAGSTIYYDLGNESAANWNDSRLVFRGVKLYPEGVVWSPSYPDCFECVPFEFPLNVTIAQQSTLRDVVVNGPTDADFVLRAIASHPDASSAAADWTAMYARVRDAAHKPYQSGSPAPGSVPSEFDNFIHADWLFAKTFAESPAILYPEIYIPRNESIYFDFRLLDAAGTLRFQLNLVGAKVFRRVTR